MKGTIRIVLGLFLVLGGVGGIEMAEETMPLDSLAVAVIGLTFLAWGAYASNKEAEA